MPGGDREKCCGGCRQGQEEVRALRPAAVTLVSGDGTGQSLGLGPSGQRAPTQEPYVSRVQAGMCAPTEVSGQSVASACPCVGVLEAVGTPPTVWQILF